MTAHRVGVYQIGDVVGAVFQPMWSLLLNLPTAPADRLSSCASSLLGSPVQQGRLPAIG